MKRPTIPDLAAAAGVSVSTVNRVLNQADAVRQPTRERVYNAAERIGFYGLGTIEYSMRAARQTHRFGVLLLRSARPFYRRMGETLSDAARDYSDGRVELTFDYVEDLSPERVAAQIVSLGERCEAIGVVAPQHAIVADAVDTVIDAGTPVVSLIGPLSARGNISFVGLDNWKVGRTAAWAFDKIVRKPGKIGMLVGNQRFRNQEMRESGFRSYFREHTEGFTILEPRSTYESAAVAREHVEELLAEHPDMCGLLVNGGGITGAITALRACQKRDDFVAVGYELFDETRAALIDGTLSLVISHPLERFARESIDTLIKAKKAGPDGGAQRVALGFEIHVAESI